MDGNEWMRVAPEEIERMGYPKWIRERIDPLRVLSLDVKGAPKASRRNPAPGTETSSGMGTAATGPGAATSSGMRAGPREPDAGTSSGMRAGATGPGGATSSGMGSEKPGPSVGPASATAPIE
jgi:hypothetical protein